MCGTNGRFVDLGFFIESGLRQQIAGQMLDHQLVVWDILLQGPYQIITVLLGKGDTRIALAAMTFAVAVPVHPVSGPTFRIRLAGQQSVDVFFIALRIFARRKPCHVVRGRRQARQHQRHPAQQGMRIGDFTGDQLLLFQTVIHKSINRIVAPIGLVHLRRFRVCDRLERPPLFTLVPHIVPATHRFFQTGGRGLGVAWIRSPHAYPLREISDDTVDQLGRFAGHLLYLRLMADGLDQ